MKNERDSSQGALGVLGAPHEATANPQWTWTAIGMQRSLTSEFTSGVGRGEMQKKVYLARVFGSDATITEWKQPAFIVRCRINKHWLCMSCTPRHSV